MTQQLLSGMFLSNKPHFPPGNGDGLILLVHCSRWCSYNWKIFDESSHVTQNDESWVILRDFEVPVENLNFLGKKVLTKFLIDVGI
jgi:hypothetical protein